MTPDEPPDGHSYYSHTWLSNHYKEHGNRTHSHTGKTSLVFNRQDRQKFKHGASRPSCTLIYLTLDVVFDIFKSPERLICAGRDHGAAVRGEGEVEHPL